MLLAFLFTLSLGSAGFEVDPENTTAPYRQEAEFLELNARASLGDMVTGVFLGPVVNWSPVDTIFLDAAFTGTKPDVSLTVGLYGWDGTGWELINSYVGYISQLGPEFGLLQLDLEEAGSGDFSRLGALEIKWNAPVSVAGSLNIRSLVGSAAALTPVVTSTSYSVGGFHMTWAGTGVWPVNIQRRTSLDSGGWITVAQGVAVGSFTDANPPPGQAFYRVVVP